MLIQTKCLMWQSGMRKIDVNSASRVFSEACVDRKHFGIRRPYACQDSPMPRVHASLRIFGAFAFAGRCFVMPVAPLCARGGLWVGGQPVAQVQTPKGSSIRPAIVITKHRHIGPQWRERSTGKPVAASMRTTAVRLPTIRVRAVWPPAREVFRSNLIKPASLVDKATDPRNGCRVDRNTALCVQ